MWGMEVLMSERPDDVTPLPDDAQVPGEEPLDDDDDTGTGLPEDDGQKPI